MLSGSLARFLEFSVQLMESLVQFLEALFPTRGYVINDKLAHTFLILYCINVQTVVTSGGVLLSRGVHHFWLSW